MKGAIYLSKGTLGKFTLLILVMSAAMGTLTRWQALVRYKSASLDTGNSGAWRLDPRIGAVEGFIRNPTNGVRIRVADCDYDVIAFPIWVTAAAVPLALDVAILRPGNGSVDVYRDEIRPRFSRVDLVFGYVRAQVYEVARRLSSFFGSSAQNWEPRKFVRLYIDSRCSLGAAKLLALARSVLESPLLGGR